MSEFLCPNAHRCNDLQTAHSTRALQVKNSSFTSCCHDLHSMVDDDWKATACMPCCYACAVLIVDMTSTSRASAYHKRPHTCLQQELPAPPSETPRCERHPCPWDNRLCPLHELPPEHVQADISKLAIFCLWILNYT